MLPRHANRVEKAVKSIRSRLHGSSCNHDNAARAWVEDGGGEGRGGGGEREGSDGDGCGIVESEGFIGTAHEGTGATRPANTTHFAHDS